MSERSTRPPADLEVDLARVADQLYALKPDDFAAARDAEVRNARTAGQQPLAREIAKLRKPTQSAWLINLLWRDQHVVMEQLFELALELARAQADAAGASLRELTAQRRQLENALMRRAVELANQAGVRVSDSVAREAQETLSAALAVPAVADEVRAGRLVKPTSYAGFGSVSPAVIAARPPAAPIDLDAVRQKRAAEQGTRTGEAASPTSGEPRGAVDDRTRTEEDESSADERRDDDERQRKAEDEQRRAEEEARRRAEEERQRQVAERRAAAERRLAQARRDAQRVSTNLADATRAAEDAHDRARDLRQQLETLQRQLARVEAEAERADQDASEAEELRQQAVAASSHATEEVSAAERDLAATADIATP